MQLIKSSIHPFMEQKMQRYRNNPRLKPLWLLLLLAQLSACVKHRELLNFQEGAEWSSLQQQALNIPEYKLQPDDIVQLQVNAYDNEAAAPFNQNYSSEQQTKGTNNTSNGMEYLLDAGGGITLPLTGRIVISGLTLSHARDTIQKRIAKFILDPIVSIRLRNFKVTVLGEVISPGQYVFQNDRVSLLDAIGSAGDLSNYGRRDNILIIREINGQRSFGRVNLKSRDFFNSPYYYLSPNDVVYIEPLKNKTGAVTDESNKIAPWVLAGITFINIFVTIFR